MKNKKTLMLLLAIASAMPYIAGGSKTNYYITITDRAEKTVTLNPQGTAAQIVTRTAADGQTKEFQDTLTTSEDSVETDTRYDTAANSDSLVCLPQLTTAEKIERLLSTELLKTSQVAFMAYDLTADSVVTAYNEKQAMRPASTMKLLTAITAIDNLGGDYRFSTWLKYRGRIIENEKRVLLGDIIVKGGMDPKFGSDDMKAFVEAIQKEHIDTLYGTILADRTFKDTLLLGEGWCWDDKNPVLTPLLWNRQDNFVKRFSEELQDAGIVFSDSMPERLKDEGTSSHTTLLCTRYHTIEQILTKMMKESDNLYAEAVFYNISANALHPASARHTRRIMQETLRRAGVQHSNYRIADGSGLSLYNYQTVEMQIALLRYAYRNSNIFEYLYPTLPIAGQDGTLKKRMRQMPCKGNVRGKTGTLTGISSLCGYLTAKSGNVIAFAIINQGVMKAAPAKDFQDRLCTILCEY